MSFQMYVPTRFVFGNGALEGLKDQKLPGSKALLLISNGKSVRENGAFERVEEQLRQVGVGTALFNRIGANPTKTVVMDGSKFAREQGCDFIVALGGGSVMDAAKAIAATESYISTFANVMSDMYALTSIENVGKYLARAVHDGRDEEAREGMAFANTLSGVVMTISLTTAEHSPEHAMSAYHHDLPHGAGLIMISKAFYEFFIEKHACDERFIRMARAIGRKGASKPEDFIAALVELQAECGVDDLRMSDYGITIGELDTIARNARETMGGLFAANPYEMNHEDCVSVLRKAYR